MTPDWLALAAPLRAGQRRALAKAITLVESTLSSDREHAQALLNALLPDTGKSIRVGISGVPGVGKSSFIEALGLQLIKQGKKVAVLAVDPSSPVHGGSILGDKTRMETLSRQERAFIRPSPSSGAIGGVALKTRESMLLCEAAGYEVILIETVGVGQSEYEVASMVDCFLVLMLPNAGDELQGIKRGIMELADLLLINKADGEGLKRARQSQSHYQNALQLLHSEKKPTPQVHCCSALENTGIEQVWQSLCQIHTTLLRSGQLEQKRAEQNSQWLHKLIHEMLNRRLQQHSDITAQLPALEQGVIAQTITPYHAANTIISLLLDKPSPEQD